LNFDVVSMIIETAGTMFWSN